MKIGIGTACFFALLSVCGHFYLAKRAYQLSAGLAKQSAICHINENINCDQALLSPYAKIFNFSISDFGFAFNLIVFLLILFALKFSLSDYWKNLSFYLSSLIALSSLGMAFLSLLHSLHCPVCWSLYLFSFILLASLFFAFKSSLKSPLVFILQAVQEKSSYLLAIVIFLCALFLHISFVNAYNIKDQKEIISALLTDWQYEPPIKIPPQHLIQKGAEDSSIVIVEFADFLCPSCKRVQEPLKRFLKNFPDVKFYFFAFPRDKACNDSFPFSRSGLSCELSKAIVCAKGKAWEFHDFFFDKQAQFQTAEGDTEKTQKLLDEIINKTQLDKAQFELCMKNESTLEKVKLSAQAGGQAEIEGTPSFFINGKKLRSYDPQLVLLYKIHQYLKPQ
ncbi:MAG: thioredoxin domain-containing protein [Oligoflexia bacterium]|nr:thioredoxin domain-containing protein [Oligoflexia bacterium]